MNKANLGAALLNGAVCPSNLFDDELLINYES